jgi:hypothetical protein
MSRLWIEPRTGRDCVVLDFIRPDRHFSHQGGRQLKLYKIKYGLERLEV